jgi:hypothetical protein
MSEGGSISRRREVSLIQTESTSAFGRRLLFHLLLYRAMHADGEADNEPVFNARTQLMHLAEIFEMNVRTFL